MRPEDLLARLEAGYAYDPMYGQLCNERDQLKAENTKLREQIASFRELSQDMVIFAGPIMGRHFARRLRKLGVEV